MAPFIFSTRKHFRKTQFSPGVLTRAYKLKPKFPSKRRRRTMDGYLLECAQKLYPQSLLDNYVSVCRNQRVSRSASFIPHLKHLVEQLSPSRFEEAPGDEQLEIFKAWARAYGRSLPGRRERGGFPDMRKKLHTLGLHISYFEALDGDYNEEEKDLFNRWIAQVESNVEFNKTDINTKSWSSLKQFSTFIGLLEELYSLSGVRDVSACGKVHLDRAAIFATRMVGHSHRITSESGLNFPKAELLVMTGFEGNTNDLANHVALLGACIERFDTVVRKQLPQNERVTSSHYLILRKMLAMDPKFASELPIEVLKEQFEKFDTQAACAEMGLQHSTRHTGLTLFKLLEAELQLQGAADKCSKLRLLMPSRCVGVTLYEQLCSQSQWHAYALHSIFRRWCEVGNGSAHPEEYARAEKSLIACIAAYIATYAEEEYKTQVPQGYSAFKWFIENATPAMLQEATLGYMREANRNHRPERVKSCQDVHSASGRGGRMIRFFKSCTPVLLPNAHVSELVLRKLLRRVENVRTPADPMVRRTYRVEEMEAMLTACANDSKMTLLLVILSEIGLRLSALRHLRYYDLSTVEHTARHVCSVLEKGRAKRNFVTSDRLKKTIELHLEKLRNVASDAGCPLADVCVFFNAMQPTEPVACITIEDWLRKVARAASVLEVKVHPHAFRHTLVGRLMDAGNSLEITSKYMGHKSLDTTSSHYWVANVQELHENLNNPMTGTYQDKVRDDDLKDKELTVLRKKKAKAMEIIENTLGALNEVKGDGGSAEDVVTKIKAAMPNLGEVLCILAEDEA